ncbi:major facilitator superfamily domain-containing protein [Chaetomium strumarium]|uniref:Major facilitator superfamily domain-containing protein n=1 Tax=Chaetomium strumarium TaxID=1170767 RepID=A0AAJ0GWM1_9PEZI|nr:major facilitator superfamily domain-containing protein [Chaetomium strumarium]
MADNINNKHTSTTTPSASSLSLSNNKGTGAMTPATRAEDLDSASPSSINAAAAVPDPNPPSQPQHLPPQPAQPDLESQQSPSPGLDPKTTNPFGARPACFPSTPLEIAFVLQATMATATSSFFQGASAIITASIGRDLGMSQGEITWITASTALTAGAFQLGLGQMADLLGRKATFIVGMASFSVFALLVAFARNPFWMDVVCGVLGVCAAMVVPPAIGIMGAAYGTPSKRKNLAFSAFSAGNPLGFVFGSVVSGVATMVVNWRASYVLIAIVWVVLAVLAVWTIPKVEAYPEGQGLRERAREFVSKFDFVGTALTILGTGLLTAAVTLGPTDGWKSPHIIAMLVLGVVLLGGFVYWETVYPHPLMPPHIWKDRNFTFIILSCLPGYMAFMAAQFWLSFLMQELQHLTPLMVAVHLLPQAIAGLVYNIIAGSVLHRINNTLLLVLGSGCYVASNALLAAMQADSPYWAFVFPSLVLGVVGADFQFNVANMYVMQSLPSHQQALAGGIFNTLFRLGAAIALGISTAVYTSFAGVQPGAALRDPMLPYAKAFQVSIGLSAASFLFLPFVRLGTQGHAGVGTSSSGGGSSVDDDGNMLRLVKVTQDQKKIPTAVGEERAAEK